MDDDFGNVDVMFAIDALDSESFFCSRYKSSPLCPLYHGQQACKSSEGERSHVEEPNRVQTEGGGARRNKTGRSPAQIESLGWNRL